MKPEALEKLLKNRRKGMFGPYAPAVAVSRIFG